MTQSQLITALITLITTIATGVGWLIRHRLAAKDPIPRTAAELALAATALGIIERSRDTLGQDIERMKTERAEDRERLDAQQRQIDELHDDNADLHAQLDKIRHLLSHATRYIETLLRWVRGGSNPPMPVIPAPLSELIDPDLYKREVP